MSIAAMMWAWQQKCEPGQKLVLLALSDNANDAGECWPGIKVLMRKTCMSRQTVIRHLAALETVSLLTKEERHRSNGAQTTNLYYLNMNVTQEQAGLDPYPHRGKGGYQSETGGVSNWDGGGTNLRRGGSQIGTPNNPNKNSNINTTTTTTTDDEESEPEPANFKPPDKCGGGDLIFPENLTPKQITSITQQVMKFPELAQDLVDELAGQMAAKKLDPVRYVSGLIRQAKAGKFEPTAAIAIQEARARQNNQSAQPEKHLSHHVVERYRAEIEATGFAYISGYGVMTRDDLRQLST